MKAGFIGLGIMGKPMAKNLLKADCELFVNDLDKAAVAELVGEGAKEGDYKKISEECDIVFLMLPNGVIVQSVLFGENGIAQYLKAGSVVCDMSSVTPTESCICAEKLKKMNHTIPVTK